MPKEKLEMKKRALEMPASTFNMAICKLMMLVITLVKATSSQKPILPTFL
jgi:hypothetical protein